MIKIKTAKEIEIMREGGKILSSVLDAVIKEVKPGISTGELNDLAEKLIAENNARPSFKNYRAPWSDYPYPAALCVSINNEVVHGIPNKKRLLADGDIVGFDCGLEYKKYFTDMAKTVVVGKSSKQKDDLVATAKVALEKAIAIIKPGINISDISKTIENYITGRGFSVVRQLVGHGVGHSAHEDPEIPNYVYKNFPDNRIEEGMTLALEPMVNAGDWPIQTLDDGWTIATLDGELSAHFEHTVAVTADGCEILTL